MPTPTMQQLHRLRRPLLAATIGVVALAVWLLVADILQRLVPSWPRSGFGRNNLMYLVTPDMGVDGLFGLRLNSTFVRVLANLVTIALYIATQWAFIRPEKNWSRRSTQHQFGDLATLSASFVAALTTVGYLALALEWIDWWRSPRCVIACAAAMSVSWVGWYLKLRLPKGKRDRFIHLIVITYVLFVAAGVLTLIAIPTQFHRHAWFEFQRGSYTAMFIGGAVMVWTLIPSMVLIWYGEYYRAATNGLCIQCMYNLEGSTSDTCPECGHPIDRSIYVQSGVNSPKKADSGP